MIIMNYISVGYPPPLPVPKNPHPPSPNPLHPPCEKSYWVYHERDGRGLFKKDVGVVL